MIHPDKLRALKLDLSLPFLVAVCPFCEGALIMGNKPVELDERGDPKPRMLQLFHEGGIDPTDPARQALVTGCERYTLTTSREFLRLVKSAGVRWSRGTPP